jgi:hypothetical protein
LTQNELECAVDEYGVAELLSALSRICDDKADHIEQNYSDASTAQWWRQRAIKLNSVASHPYMQDE